LIYYVYAADDGGHLLGVACLRDLIRANPEATLADLMEPRVVTVGVEEEKEEIADLFAKYAFKAIPVVDEEKRIKGVINFRSLLEVVAPQLGK
jgi:magnesium transporter